MDVHDSVRDKTWEIFAEVFGSRADLFKGGIAARSANDILSAALAEDYEPLIADEIAFHLVDWETDAAFLVAFMLFPERFTKAELQAATEVLLLHVPAHLMAAARLAGHDSTDIFKEEDAG